MLKPQANNSGIGVKANATTKRSDYHFRVHCPACGSLAGRLCRAKDGSVIAKTHLSRVDLAQEKGFGPHA